MRSVQSVRWVVAAAVTEALIGLLALRLACLSAMGVLGFVGLIVAAFVVMSWYCGLGLEYRFEVTALFLGWLALMISGVLLAFVFRRDPLQTRATDHEGEEGERQSHRQETDKHKQRLLPLSRRYDARRVRLGRVLVRRLDLSARGAAHVCGHRARRGLVVGDQVAGLDGHVVGAVVVVADSHPQVTPLMSVAMAPSLI